jgi:hypothetical protein
VAQGTGTPTINQVIAVLIKEINNEIKVLIQIWNPNANKSNQKYLPN